MSFKTNRLHNPFDPKESRTCRSHQRQKLLHSTGILRRLNFRSTRLAKALRIVQASIPELGG